MQAHSFASRLLAALLTVTWAMLALALLATPPGGGITGLLLALAAFVPALASAAAIVWPVAPVAVDGRRGWAVGWLGVSAVLLAIPFAILIGGPLVAGVAQPILPSTGIAYAGLLAVAATTVYGAYGWAEASRTRPTHPPLPGRLGPRDMRPVLVGIALTGLVAATSGFALAGSTGALAGSSGALAGSGGALAGSGGAPAGVPRDCGEPQIPPYARVTIDASASLDATTIARASVSGERNGPDEHWSGTVGGDLLENRAYEYAFVGGSATLRTGGGEWQVVDDADGAIPGHLDGRVASVLAEPGLPPLEDLGIDLVDGAAARHCRISVGGEHAFRAFVPLGWLLGRPPLDRGPALEIWRGDLDWWTFAGGQLGRATVLIGGHPGDAWTNSGLRGTLRAEMRVVERDVPRTIDEPLP